MTDAERLKVAEEMIAAFCQKATLLSDISLGWSHTEPHYHTQRLHVTPRHRMGVGEFLSVSNDPIEAVILARQKLAAEREAAMTPREKKWKAALEEVVRTVNVASPLCNCNQAYGIARKALEES